MKRLYCLNGSNFLFILSNLIVFLRALDTSAAWEVVIRPASRTTEQNAKFHALVSDIAKSRLEWAGKRRNAAQWKVLLVSGHAIATGDGADMVPGLEGEFVNLRESTALMSTKRSASLIEYTIAFAACSGVETLGMAA